MFVGCAEESPSGSSSSTVSDLPTGTGGRYVDAQTGLCATFGSEWTLYSETELAALNGTVSSDTATVVLYASRIDGLAAINAVSGQTDEQSEEDYLRTAVEELQRSMENAGVTELSVSTAVIPFAGEERTVICCEGNSGGLLLYEKIVLLHSERRVLSITLSSYGEDLTAYLAAMFETL